MTREIGSIDCVTVCRLARVLGRRVRSTCSSGAAVISRFCKLGTPINIAAIKRLCALGLDDCPPEDRAVAWLVLSGVFPPTPESWTSLKQFRLKEYMVFVRDFAMTGYETKLFPNTSEPGPLDVRNQALMGLIHGDIVRTSHHIIFFPHPDPSVEGDDPNDCLWPFHAHLRRLERVLYLFACVNPTLSYLQGFNELASVLYFVFLSALPIFEGSSDEVEAFVFYSFQQLLGTTGIQELFTTQDRSSLIHGRLRRFMEVLRSHVPRAHSIIIGHDIHPLCFCFRWLNLLFAQEYLIPNLVMIWDSLFAHFDELVEYATYLAAAQVSIVETRLRQDDYVESITALQKVHVDDIRKLLDVCDGFWAHDHRAAKRGILARLKKKHRKTS